jgi:hypothetical protein
MKPPAPVSAVTFTEIARMPLGKIADMKPVSSGMTSFLSMIGSPSKMAARALACSYLDLASGWDSLVIMNVDTVDFGHACQPIVPPTSRSPICRLLVATRTSTVSTLVTSTAWTSVCLPTRPLAI